MLNWFRNQKTIIFSNILANYETRLSTMILYSSLTPAEVEQMNQTAQVLGNVYEGWHYVAYVSIQACTAVFCIWAGIDPVVAGVSFVICTPLGLHAMNSFQAKGLKLFKKGYVAGVESVTGAKETAINETNKIVDTIKIVEPSAKSSDPLEQFDVVSLVKAIEWTNLSWILLLCLILFGFWVWSFSYKTFTNYDFVLKSIFRLVKNILKENLYIKKQQYFSILFYLFIVILLCNMVGLIPYSFTVTSSFVVTFFLALMHFLGINLVAITEKKWEFQQLLLPGDSPLPIAPFLVFIEGVSYVARVFSLSIRLFANMMSGHALLKILIGFSWNLLTSGGLIAILALVPWTIVTIIMFLELLIAFLQAYVFVILVTIYINDVLNMH